VPSAVTDAFGILVFHLTLAISSVTWQIQIVIERVAWSSCGFALYEKTPALRKYSSEDEAFTAIDPDDCPDDVHRYPAPR